MADLDELKQVIISQLERIDPRIRDVICDESTIQEWTEKCASNELTADELKIDSRLTRALNTRQTKFDVFEKSTFHGDGKYCFYGYYDGGYKINRSDEINKIVQHFSHIGDFDTGGLAKLATSVSKITKSNLVEKFMIGKASQPIDEAKSYKGIDRR